MAMDLPFFAADAPCRLPTDTEIDEAPDISMEYGGRRIVAVGSHYVVKYGKGVNLIEGENMLYIQKTTSVPVPRVYALYSNQNTGKNYIVMQRIPGQTLLSVWPQLHASGKTIIIAKLRSYFDELRQLHSPGYYGSLGQRCLLDEIFWTLDPDPTINGPFVSEGDLNEALPRKYLHDGQPTYRAEFYRQCLPRIFCNHKPTFTHGDFQRKNIMIDGNLDDPQSLRLTILDWEKSGWYPSYWEYCLAVCALRWDDDWCLWVEKVVDPYVSEAAWLQAIRLELWS